MRHSDGFQHMRCKVLNEGMGRGDHDSTKELLQLLQLWPSQRRHQRGGCGFKASNRLDKRGLPGRGQGPRRSICCLLTAGTPSTGGSLSKRVDVHVKAPRKTLSKRVLLKYL